jgi:hypothetical protein
MLLSNERRHESKEAEWEDHDERGASGRSYRLEFEVEHREEGATSSSSLIISIIIIIVIIIIIFIRRNVRSSRRWCC